MEDDYGFWAVVISRKEFTGFLMTVVVTRYEVQEFPTRDLKHCVHFATEKQAEGFKSALSGMHSKDSSVYSVVHITKEYIDSLNQVQNEKL